MTWNQLEGQWNDFRGVLRSRWSKLTEEDVQTVAGKKDLLVGKLLERYGMLRGEADRQADEWLASVSFGSGTKS